ncbi:MAG: NAD(P)H-dependent oxidoreductase subunit E [Bryobacterales bacterium]|nr:NAD(P)H-dependent oxidoreductase subunit E [Bryobacterales bacterium]
MTPDELREAAQIELAAQARYTQKVSVCTAAGCASCGGVQVKEAIQRQVAEEGLKEQCLVRSVGCMGLCSAGPLVAVEPDGTLYHHVAPDHAPEIVRGLDLALPVKDLVCPTDQPFFARQHKIVLENCGRIDPDKLPEAIAAGGYEGLAQALTTRSPAEVIHEVTVSGLRGRGGGGYPTGIKWTTVAKAFAAEKYVICNGDEGDPGAFMDRALLESDPHRVLEGMTIAAYAVGASRGYMYVRAEYPLAVTRLKSAIRQAERAGLLGKNICGTPFSFDVDIRLGAGAFVCGEETALIASVEGRRGAPRPRPPYPAESGLWGAPTLINNVETFGNIPSIIRKGGDWYASMGTEKSKGTKVFALAGCIRNTGLIEVPMGITLREIVFDIGGGVPEGREFKAIQTGGPSGGCIPEHLLDTPVDYESLHELGSIMGSGGMIVMDDSASMVETARFFMEFSMAESCGKCVPCRVGTAHLYDLLDKFARGDATPADLALLEELCDVVKNTSLCGLGISAPNPVLSTLRFFRHEYEEKLKAVTA